MNLMTPELQRTTALTGELGDVSLFKSSWVAVGVMLPGRPLGDFGCALIFPKSVFSEP